LNLGGLDEIVQGVDRLRFIGVIRGDNSIDYSLVLQATPPATRDEYLKQALLKFAVEKFRGISRPRYDYLAKQAMQSNDTDCDGFA
jgi:hypothetical protein